jgi:hypothetical protein
MPAVAALIVFALASLAAWFTHVAWIVKVLASATPATTGQVVLGILGAFVPPVGVVHGVVLWFS